MMKGMKGCCVVFSLAVAVSLFPTAHPAFAFPVFAQNWRDLSPRERYDALQNYWRHQQLPDDRKRDMENRYERWQKMPPDERARIRQNFERFRQLPPQERERFQRKYDKWKRESEPPPPPRQ